MYKLSVVIIIPGDQKEVVIIDNMDIYDLSYEEFSEHSDIPFQLVEDHEALNEVMAEEIADLIEENNQRGKETTVIFPVGPLDYNILAATLNRREVDLSRLKVYMMDEYLGEDGKLIPEDHPLSFRRFMRNTFVGNLEGGLGMSMDRVIFPRPSNLEEISREILDMDGVQVCYGGFGITGHFAFNDPPEPGEQKGLDWLRNTTARELTITRESTTQMVMGGSHGNWEVVPSRAVTLGMKEMLASDEIQLTFMRDWHAGVLRRALFGPVSVECPGSLMQEHPNVEATLTEIAAKKPLCDVSQETGEEE